jgi:hypothetical protein
MGSKGKYGNMEILTVSGRSDNVRTWYLMFLWLIIHSIFEKICAMLFFFFIFKLNPTFEEAPSRNIVEVVYITRYFLRHS